MSAGFDIHDEHQVHAYMVLGFGCSDCRRELPIDSAHEVATDEWCLDAAHFARAAGWYVPPVDREGRMDVETTYCDACAARRRLASAQAPLANRLFAACFLAALAATTAAAVFFSTQPLSKADIDRISLGISQALNTELDDAYRSR